ncbi:type II secretion system protein [Acidaminobacter sp. JC074]|uniref:type II secretion system protein n=1 Tax=Acidaminobacter sp. JC074 TaxID=2530199 RepID=UPI001F111C9C|nr:type II secretion system protein [Acidaminobacter sp. JC074]MCH4888181.1 type II secretion system protein [Acidaminobacter sp. JC074]
MRNRDGFTMLEIILVMAVVVVLITLFLPNMGKLDETVSEQVFDKHVMTIQKSLAQYFILEGDYPVSLAMLSKDSWDNKYGIRLSDDYEYSYQKTENAYQLSVERK